MCWDAACRSRRQRWIGWSACRAPAPAKPDAVSTAPSAARIACWVASRNCPRRAASGTSPAHAVSHSSRAQLSFRAGQGDPDVAVLRDRAGARRAELRRGERRELVQRPARDAERDARHHRAHQREEREPPLRAVVARGVREGGGGVIRAHHRLDLDVVAVGAAQAGDVPVVEHPHPGGRDERQPPVAGVAVGEGAAEEEVRVRAAAAERPAPGEAELAGAAADRVRGEHAAADRVRGGRARRGTPSRCRS